MIDVVCDASVALKWFHAEGEEGVDEARELLDHYRRRTISLSILDLTPYEIGNALLRGGTRLDAGAVGAVLDALLELCPRLAVSSAELTDAARLAENYQVTLYDAAYAAAARMRGARLATYDRDVLRAHLGQRPHDVVADLATE
jgi:predicted nucleic acid-binding protein